MAVIAWVPAAAVTAGTPYAPPSSARPPRMLGVRNAVIVPATSGATTNPVMESGVMSGAGSGTNGAPGPGQITVIVATQQLVSGDNVPANGVVILNVVADGENDYNP